MWAPVLVACGLSSCVSQALEHGLNSCGSWALLVPSMWVLSRSGIEPISPARARGFFTTEPPGTPPRPDPPNSDISKLKDGVGNVSLLKRLQEW